ncbi:MAG: Fic family protein [Proteobacteria bacterium]|nr:Fic family protein [Pseudomonadota bacterium]
MTYNWQLPDWPKFQYDLKGIEDQLFIFAEKAGHISGLMQGLPNKTQEEAILDLMVFEAIKTSQIEGENLLRSDVMSSIRNNLGLNPTPEKVGDKKAQGVGQLMVEVRKNFAEPLSEAMLFNWHQILMGAFSKRIAVGQWRDHEDPMQIISGPIGREKVHFEAPPSASVKKEMDQFIAWFNATAPNGKTPIKSPVVRAAVAHIYFESIHPFEDGNGRIGRAISEKALSQGLGRPVIMSLSKAIEAKRRLYYDALGTAQTSNNVTDWIRYFVTTAVEAQEDAERTIGFILFKTKLFDRFRDQMNERQTKVVSRMLENGPSGFEGGMSARKYISITGASRATATRDLQQLVEMGVFEEIGEGRSTHYQIRADI